MAKSLHVPHQAVSNWERGKSYPDISNIIMISDLYSISLDELIREDKNYKDILLEKKAASVRRLKILFAILKMDLSLEKLIAVQFSQTKRARKVILTLDSRNQ